MQGKALQPELGLSGPQHPCRCLPGHYGDSYGQGCGWLERAQQNLGRRGPYYDLGGPIRPPEEEFDQLYRNQRAAGSAPKVDRKVGSDEGEPVPPSCDWRKAPGVISSVKNQVSASPSLAQSSPSGGREMGGGVRPRSLTSPPPLPARKPAHAAGPWRPRATSKRSGPLKTRSLWKSLCRVRLEEGHVCPGGLGPGAQSPTLSLLAPELLDCGRCGDGCRGGFVWDAFITVLNNSECRPTVGGRGAAGVGGGEERGMFWG